MLQASDLDKKGNYSIISQYHIHNCSITSRNSVDIDIGVPSTPKFWEGPVKNSESRFRMPAAESAGMAAPHVVSLAGCGIKTQRKNTNLAISVAENFVGPGLTWSDL